MPLAGDSDQPYTRVRGVWWSWAARLPPLVCGHTMIHSPQSQARARTPLHLLPTWTERELWLPAKHSVLYFRETLWNIIGPFTEFCLDKQGTEEAFTLWVPSTLIIVRVTIASGPNKRCLRKQGIRHQLWFMGSWKKCSTQKITHRPSLVSVL